MGQYMVPLPDDTCDRFIAAVSNRGEKYRILARVGFETGLRVSDILKIKSGRIRANFSIIQGKTKKAKKISLSDGLLNEIKAYQAEKHLSRDDYLIYSRWYVKDKPLSRVQAYRVFKAAAAELNLEGIGPHSMRKTYAKELYIKTGGDITAVKRALDHKYLETTLRYFMNFNNLLPQIPPSMPPIGGSATE